ncbi:hypothetical protein AGOR_G00243480 [Albula goreensis]|uniref:Uncharacterized protein n=1 Tax=Albula goreensis TaxID=1534307 RepID=A0A8T3CHG5_9TELE|nr:hypothetical protein AGOR_G00243480 [Albula goreensis]
MENYFQAEAFNLDKVLDEFEQNEDESDTPTLTDAKWTQILAPPAHLLTLNPALTNAELSPYEPPLGLKPAAALEDRPLGLRSPLSPQPNIGKLVTSGSLENGHPSSPDLNGRADEPQCILGRDSRTNRRGGVQQRRGAERQGAECRTHRAWWSFWLPRRGE